MGKLFAKEKLPFWLFGASRHLVCAGGRWRTLVHLRTLAVLVQKARLDGWQLLNMPRVPEIKVLLCEDSVVSTFESCKTRKVALTRSLMCQSCSTAGPLLLGQWSSGNRSMQDVGLRLASSWRRLWPWQRPAHSDQEARFRSSGGGRPSKVSQRRRRAQAKLCIFSESGFAIQRDTWPFTWHSSC